MGQSGEFEIERRTRDEAELVADAIGAFYVGALEEDWSTALDTLVAMTRIGRIRLAVSQGRGWKFLGDSKRGDGPQRLQEEARAIAIAGDGRVHLVCDQSPRPRARRLLEVVAVHAARAVDLAEDLRRERARRRAVAATLDRLRTGVLLLDDRGRVAASNRAARELLAGNLGLTLDDGKLRAATLDTNRALAQMIARAVGASTSRGPQRSEHFELSCRGRRPLRLLAVPLSGEVAAGGHPCAVFVSDSEKGVAPPEHVLSKHYGLTRAEARVTARLLRGLAVDAVAVDLGIKRETVRSHVKRIYAKVGTTRQSDLVALLLRGPAELRWD